MSYTGINGMRSARFPFQGLGCGCGCGGRGDCLPTPTARVTISDPCWNVPNETVAAFAVLALVGCLIVSSPRRMAANHRRRRR